MPANYPPPNYPPPAYVPPAAYRPDYGPPTWPAELGLVLPEAAVAVGDLPRICVLSGRPTEHMVRVRWPKHFDGKYDYRPSSVKLAWGLLPIDAAVRSRRSMWVAGGFAGFGVGFIALTAGAVGDWLAIIVLGLAMMVAATGAIAVHGRQAPKIVRAAPGFLAIPQASPEFVAAFRAGRPPGGQTAARSAKPSRWWLLLLVPALIVVALIAVGIAMGMRHNARCSPLRSHENATIIYVALDRRSAIQQMQSGPDTRLDAQNLLVADKQLLATLMATQLRVDDGVARDNYVAALSRYDKTLGAAVARGVFQTSPQQLAARQALVAADTRLRAQLSFVPGNCSFAG